MSHQKLLKNRMIGIKKTYKIVYYFYQKVYTFNRDIKFEKFIRINVIFQLKRRCRMKKKYE